MNAFLPGDRVRVQSTGDDGFPLVRYGFVGGSVNGEGPVTVMLDDDLRVTVLVDRSQIVPVSITNVELRLRGADLLDDPSLRHGLAHLWAAEAEQAGLDIGALHPVGDGLRDSSEGYLLAEITAAGEHYVLRAVRESAVSDAISVRVELPGRWGT